ncbi:MAG: PEFG-CTERM sorting domain-containing protein, partial [Nitrosopumilaceae archaeon]
AGIAQVGGESEDYYFTEDQTGPTIIKFENIRNTGQETEFGIVVAPEFGTYVLMIFVLSLVSVVFISKKSSLNMMKF